MKKLLVISIITLVIISCCKEKEVIKAEENNSIVGTWKLVYAEIKENDSLQIRDVSKSDFIKILNETHFSFLSQDHADSKLFYGAGGTYTIKDDLYTETLLYTSSDDYRGHHFPFTVQVTKDSLIQQGKEETKDPNIKRYIVEKYIRIK